MAEDWIKARADLYRDPKVCRIAEILMAPDGALMRHVMINTGNDMNVTRDVMRYVTVGALVTLWGVTRLQGQRNGNDLMLRYATLKTLDDMANFPGIGDAMSLVGWAIETPEGVTLPRFFEDNNAEPLAGKGTGAERQRRYRERLKASSCDVTDDVTVTSRDASREEKRREEKNSNAARFDAQTRLDSLGVSPNVVRDWMAIRKAKKAPVTETALEAIQREADKAGLSLHDALTVCCERNWQGFKAEWMADKPINGHKVSDSIFG